MANYNSPWNKGLTKKTDKRLINLGNNANHSGKNNPMYGKVHSKESKEKISLAMKGRGHPHTLESKLKISLANRGKKRKPFSKKWRKNMSIANSGKNNPHFGKPLRPHWGKYKGINMRSSWEIAYAKWLNKNNIKWQYESKTFDLGDNTYTPDFYLLETDEYIEIKGFFPNEVKEKIQLFRWLYPNKNFKILLGRDLCKLGISIPGRFI